MSQRQRPEGTSSGSLQASSRPCLQDKSAARQAKRAAKAAERHQRSEALKEEGNVLFRNGDYEGAANRYQQAIRVHTSVKPVLWTNLANAYSRLGKFVDAHEAAEKALFADPKSVKARFQRAMARKNMESYTAAAIDLHIVLRLDPRYSQDLKRELAYVEKCRDENWTMEEDYGDNESEDEFPAPEDGSEFGESLSESSDCEHKGNSRPCRWYNRDGCTKGRACPFSHAPDLHSERDSLGRNVCKYYLMDVCKFGDQRCAYSHSKEYLLQKGWWSTPEGVDKAKNIYKVQKKFKDAAIEYERQNKMSTNSQTGPESKKKRSREKKRHGQPLHSSVGELRTGVMTIAGENQATHASPGSSSQNPFPTDHTAVTSLASFEEDDSEDEDEGYGVMGFTDAEVQELWCHGLKPWDNEARDFLKALHEEYRKMDALEHDENEEGKAKLDERAHPERSGPGVSLPPIAGGSQSTQNVLGRTSRKKKSKKSKKQTNGPCPNRQGYDSDEESGVAMCGFSNNEVEELLSYGVKPWDDDAWDFMHAVRSWPTT